MKTLPNIKESIARFWTDRGLLPLQWVTIVMMVASFVLGLVIGGLIF